MKLSDISKIIDQVTIFDYVIRTYSNIGSNKWWRKKIKNLYTRMGMETCLFHYHDHLPSVNGEHSHPD